MARREVIGPLLRLGHPWYSLRYDERSFLTAMGPISAQIACDGSVDKPTAGGSARLGPRDLARRRTDFVRCVLTTVSALIKMPTHSFCT